jgi:hypothetical protein
MIALTLSAFLTERFTCGKPLVAERNQSTAQSSSLPELSEVET